MNTIIYYRDDVDWRQEAESAHKYFNCVKSRMAVPDNSLVIPRFSALPFYKELEEDLKFKNSKLINSYADHLYIADLQNWYYDLEKYTFKTWFKIEYIPEKGPFVLKGETNSKKFLWNTHMFAKDKREAIAIESKLFQDSLLTYQKIIVREYVPLVTYTVAFNGLPITKEFRFFCYKDKILCGAYYWSSHLEELEEMGIVPDINDVPKEWLQDVVNIVKENANGFVIDVAETQDGRWLVVELNDLSQSGLSCNSPEIFYKELRNVL